MDAEGKVDEAAGAPAGERERNHVGMRLRAAREQAGLSLQDIAERTRIPTRHLSALEDGRHDDLPAVTYAAGFAKNYARAVGLDPAEISAQYRDESSPDPLPYYEMHEPVDPARVPTGRVIWVSAVIGLVVIAVLLAMGSGIFSNWSLPADEPAAVADDGNASPAQAPAANTQQAAPVVPPPAVTPVSSEVVLTASEDAWLKVYDKAGQTVRMGILNAGEQYAVPGDPRQLLLWTGKAGAIHVMVNGKPVAPLGGLAQTVRDVSLDPASLMARRAPPAPAARPLQPGTPAAAAAPANSPATGNAGAPVGAAG